MELRHLRYFVAVAETLHFGQAAANLGIAQPSLSHQIRQLESQLQTSLLKRTKRRVEFTEAGRRFLEEARDILARADRAAVLARRLGRTDAQGLKLGVGYCMDHTEVSLLVGQFNARHLEVQVELKTMAVPTQIAALREGHLDVGFVRPPINDDALNTEVLIREPLVAALPPNHRLRSRTRIPLSALANDAFVLPPRDTVPRFHDAVLKACREAGFVPHAPHEADHLQMILGMVAAGAAVGLVPAAARKIKQHRVVYLPLYPSTEALETAVAWRRDDASPLVAEFLREAGSMLRSARAIPPVS
jgi:DNA-binding transcriptional LysR family regulator